MSSELKWTSLSVVCKCGAVLGTFYTKEDYNRFRDDAWRSKYLGTIDCTACKAPIDWDKYVKAHILETRINTVTNAPIVHFEEVKMNKKEISKLENSEMS